MKTKIRIICITLLLSILTACGGSKGSIQVTETPRTGGKLTRTTEAELTKYLKESTQQLSYLQESDFVTSAPVADGAPTSNSFSSTNLQESGVDEADLIKTDGRYIYSVDKYTSLAVDVDILPNSNNQTSDSIRIMDTSTEVISELKLIKSESTLWNINGLYLDLANKQLIATASTNPYYPKQWFQSAYFVNQTTELLFVDIEDPANAEVKKTVSFDGTLIDSRRNGDMLYLVMRSYPEIQENTGITSANALPRFAINQSEKQPLVKASDCYVEEGSTKSSDIITLVAIDLTSADTNINSQCFVGATEALYASTDALYLSTTVWPYQVTQNKAVYDPKMTTSIHKFAYDQLDFDYRGSAEVSGHLGYQQDRKSFRFSEKDGLLRVITFDEEQWGVLASVDTTEVLNTTTASDSLESVEKSPVSLTILAEDPGELALKQVSKLPNESRPAPIGLEGEKLYASRFFGDKAYLVTFRVVDPLYVLDLSNSEDPFIAGELKIEGYSDYLHPVNENLLLGIGKDAIPDESSIFGDGRGAWYQGVKLSLIDVTDPANPKEADKLIIGKRGTETPALYDHHAISSMLVGNNLRVALPIKRHEGLAEEQETQPWSHHIYQDTGLYKFNVDVSNQTITQEVPMIVESNIDNAYDSSFYQDRSVLINDDVYYLHGGKFWKQNWAGTEAMAGPQ